MIPTRANELSRATACPDAEMLAAFMDARASRRERRELLEHLDVCEDCREVLGDSAEYASFVGTAAPWRCEVSPESEKRQGELPNWESPGASRFGRWAFVLPAAAIVAIVLLAPFGQVLHQGQAISSFSTEELVSLLLNSLRAEALSEETSSFRANHFGFASGVASEQASFRLGVHFVGLRVCITRDDVSTRRRIVQDVLKLLPVAALENLEVRFKRLSDAGSVDGSELTELENAVRGQVRTDWFVLGSWSETGRLAAAYHADAFLDGAEFRAVTESLLGASFSGDVEERVREIADLLDRSSGSSPAIVEAFTSLIASN